MGHSDHAYDRHTPSELINVILRLSQFELHNRLPNYASDLLL